AEPAGGLERRGDLIRRPLALDLHGEDDDLDRRVTSRQRRQYVPKGRRLPRGDHADRARQGRQRSFRVGIEQALFFELVAQPKEGFEQGAEPCAPHGLDIELEIVARLIQADERLHLYLHAVARRPLEVLVTVLELVDENLGLVDLVAEVSMW